MFAQISKEAIINLKGIRYHLFSIVQLEMFESGTGVCNLTLKELCEKYPTVLENYDSLCRYRRQLIKDGWLVEVVGGIVTKGFNITDKISVEPEDTDILSVNEENTDEISVNSKTELIKYQSDTDEISGTPIANKDLDFKRDLNTHSHTARAGARDFPLIENHEFLIAHKTFFPHYDLSLFQQETILARIRDGTIWRQALAYWASNDCQAKSVGKLCDKYDEIISEGDEKNAVNSNGSHRNGNDGNRFYRSGGKPRVENNSSGYNPFAGKDVI